MTEGRADAPTRRATINGLVHVIGGLTPILARHNEAAGVTTIAEIANHLGVFAKITDETQLNARAVLAYCAEVLGDVVGNCGGSR